MIDKPTTLMGLPIIWSDKVGNFDNVELGNWDDVGGLWVDGQCRLWGVTAPLHGIRIHVTETLKDNELLLVPKPISDEDWSNVKVIGCNRNTYDMVIAKMTEHNQRKQS